MLSSGSRQWGEGGGGEGEGYECETEFIIRLYSYADFDKHTRFPRRTYSSSGMGTERHSAMSRTTTCGIEIIGVYLFVCVWHTVYMEMLGSVLRIRQAAKIVYFVRSWEFLLHVVQNGAEHEMISGVRHSAGGNFGCLSIYNTDGVITSHHISSHHIIEHTNSATVLHNVCTRIKHFNRRFGAGLHKYQYKRLQIYNRLVCSLPLIATYQRMGRKWYERSILLY